MPLVALYTANAGWLFINAPSIVHRFVSERRDIESGVTESVEQFVFVVSWAEFLLGVFDIDSC